MLIKTMFDKLHYVNKFDFSIFSSIPPLRLLDGHAKTRWHVARFGGGLPTRPLPAAPPDAVAEEEARYVRCLLDAYGDHLRREVRRIEDVADAPTLHEHFTDSVSRTDLAQHVALSEDYLTACFRQELGVTPIAYLNRYRVHQARQLLTTTDKSVTEIALDVGFSDSGYFSRVFRREVGLSPEAYRQA